MTIEARVRGMTCQGCEEVVETAVELLSAVKAVDANRYENQVIVEGNVDPEAVADKIELAGYRVESAGPAPEGPSNGSSSTDDEVVDEDLEDDDQAESAGEEASADSGNGEGFERAAAEAVEQADRDVEAQIDELAEDLEE